VNSAFLRSLADFEDKHQLFSINNIGSNIYNIDVNNCCVEFLIVNDTLTFINIISKLNLLNKVKYTGYKLAVNHTLNVDYCHLIYFWIIMTNYLKTLNYLKYFLFIMK